MTLDTLRAARGSLATLIVTATALAASFSRPETGSQDVMTIGDGNNGYLAIVLDSTVARTDFTILDDRERDLRRVLVTMSIPPGRDSVVINPERRESSSGDGKLEFFNLNVNSVAVATPSNLRRILVRRWDRGALEVTMSVQLGRCSRLNFTVVEYAGGRRTKVGLPQHDSDIPNCCSTSLPGTPADDEVGSGTQMAESVLFVNRFMKNQGTASARNRPGVGRAPSCVARRLLGLYFCHMWVGRSDFPVPHRD